MQAALRIDLAAILANWHDLVARHPAGAVAGVVKADAYGLGAAPVARALADARCRHFFVAQAGEGMALRAAIGPGPMIAVLNGLPPGFEPAAALTPVLNSLGDLAAQRARPGGAGAILHLDTGMARLGLDAGEQAALAADPALLAGLDLRYVMSHLACADEAEHPLNADQAARFADYCGRVLPGIPRSLANSSGILLGAGFGSDLARPGCALYGLNPSPARPNPMRQVVTLAAPILQIRDVPAGASVGYGAGWVAARPSRIATVGVGYADGFLRALSGTGAFGLLDGGAVPLVGRVSMDLTTFDVTDAPAARPGALVTLIGDSPGLTPDALAARCGTIGYEVLTALGARYRREYLPAPGGGAAG